MAKKTAPKELKKKPQKLSRKERKAAKSKHRALGGRFKKYPHLVALKPKERYVFRSDYFEVDNYVATVMAFFHDEAAQDNFGPFWGINKIPDGLGNEVTVVLLEQSNIMGEKWINDNLAKTDKLDKLEANEQATTGTAVSKRRSAKISMDFDVIADEITNGAAYMHVHYRLFVKAPNLEKLDEAVAKISSTYVDRFGTISVAPYHGEQRQELSTLFSRNSVKRGKGYYFTSTELAGSHSLVTNGLSDPTGEFVGSMVGDVNNSAVLFDVNKYHHHVVVADNSSINFNGRTYISNLWGSKISQSAMLNNGRVVHFILDKTNLDKIGPKFELLTSKVDLNKGDVNMFEMFGDPADELSIFASHMQKLILMTEQAYEATDADRSIIRGSLEDIATKFYVDQRMWRYNAGENRDKLRVVGIPHEDVPLLQLFITYLDAEYKGLLQASARDESMIHAVNTLRMTYKNLLNTNGDLFNTITDASIDTIRDNRRVIYDLSKLMRRGKGVAMAQLVNVIGFAVDTLGENDVVIIHGTEHIDDGVKDYINIQFDHLFDRGGRVVYLYDDVGKMLKDKEFNKFTSADYTLLGTMEEQVATQYQELIGQEMPPDLEKLITIRDGNIIYLRRGVTNVVFDMALSLGVDPARESFRAEAAKEIARRKSLALKENEATVEVEKVTTMPQKSAKNQRRVIRRKRMAGNSMGAQ